VVPCAPREQLCKRTHATGCIQGYEFKGEVGTVVDTEGIAAINRVPQNIEVTGHQLLDPAVGALHLQAGKQA
jgi:hypothetical protein